MEVHRVRVDLCRPHPRPQEGARYAKGVKREALRVLFGGKTDVPTAASRMRERLGWSPSPSTVKRILLGAAQGIRTPQAPSIGIFLGDEKCGRGKDPRLPALGLRETENVVRPVKLPPTRSSESIEALPHPVAKRAGASTPLSDPWKRYRGVAHRLLLPHLFSPLLLLKIRSDHLHIYLSNKRWGMTTQGRKRKKGRIGVHFHPF